MIAWPEVGEVWTLLGRGLTRCALVLCRAVGCGEFCGLLFSGSVLSICLNERGLAFVFCIELWSSTSFPTYISHALLDLTASDFLSFSPFCVVLWSWLIWDEPKEISEVLLIALHGLSWAAGRAADDGCWEKAAFELAAPSCLIIFEGCSFCGPHAAWLLELSAFNAGHWDCKELEGVATFSCADAKDAFLSADFRSVCECIGMATASCTGEAVFSRLRFESLFSKSSSVGFCVAGVVNDSERESDTLLGRPSSFGTTDLDTGRRSCMACLLPLFKGANSDSDWPPTPEPIDTVCHFSCQYQLKVGPWFMQVEEANSIVLIFYASYHPDLEQSAKSWWTIKLSLDYWSSWQHTCR